ncbi:MAG TPA: DEAD/DEAH box helicase, partial [Muribaculaceae bacterium]|nr:DEAD/DEAH box helicase [Muribaculaceae bacterium]
GQVDLRRVAILVLDEYDKSLELGFIDEMRRIIKRITGPSTVVLTSATPIDTMPDFIPLKGAKVYDYSGSASSPRSRLDIIAVNSPERDKLDTLVKLLRTIPDGKVIVFANHRESAERIHARLVDAGLPAGLYHGGLDQQRREIAVDMLNNGSTPILVSTDLGSRGL